MPSIVEIFVFWGILGAPVALAAVGLLWSPFAATICFLIARKRGLMWDGYGWAGFRYSVLFLLPWMYLVLRMAGVPASKVVERAGYALLYGVWGVIALAFAAFGVVWAYWGWTDSMIVAPDVPTASYTGPMFVVAGLFIAVLWFVSLRRLLRRHVLRDMSHLNTDDGYAPSVPMRIACAALHILWLLAGTTVFMAGVINVMYPGLTCPGDPKPPVWYAGIPAWVCLAIMALVWVWARKRFTLRKADSWDYPPTPTPNLLPPDDAYITPYWRLYLMTVIPSVVVFALVIVALILYGASGGDFIDNCR